MFYRNINYLLWEWKVVNPKTSFASDPFGKHSERLQSLLALQGQESGHSCWKLLRAEGKGRLARALLGLGAALTGSQVLTDLAPA